MAEQRTAPPLRIRMHERDNVAIVANDGGLPAGTAFDDGLVLVDRVPQGHKVALVDIPAGAAVRRYDVVIGTALRDLPAGSWVHERVLAMPEARPLEGLPFATAPNIITRPSPVGCANSTSGRRRRPMQPEAHVDPVNILSGMPEDRRERQEAVNALSDVDLALAAFQELGNLS